MKRVKTRWWALVLGVVATAGLAVSLAVLAGGEGELIVTPYSDVIRFEAPGAASLQVQIYDLSGNLLWDSGVVSGGVVDWDRTDEYGERLAYGTYLYLVQGWNSSGDLVLREKGRVSLLPGDKLQLQRAPLVSPEAPETREEESSIAPENPLAPMWSPDEEDIILRGATTRYVKRDRNDRSLVLAGGTGWQTGAYLQFYGGQEAYGNAGSIKLYFGDYSATTPPPSTLKMSYLGNGTIKDIMTLTSSGNVGIGTTSPAGKLDISNTADQPALRIEASSGTNLIEAYNTGSGSATGLIFRVERETGDVHAVGAFYGAGFYSGSADVAEHINVSEPMEPGDVVEIDPEKPGYFRKARGAYSRLVAGVISSDPGVVLGSNSDPVEGEGDPRPVLALAGRVPVKATTENGPIHVGDLLVASSKPGYAMRCTDPASAVGAVIGKALEPLEEGEGIIMVQVTLR